jgi:predicted transcriptional regulator
MSHDSWKKRRPSAKIRNKILASVRKYPKTTWEVMRDVECSLETAQRHLSYLEQVGAVAKIKQKMRVDTKTKKGGKWVREKKFKDVYLWEISRGRHRGEAVLNEKIQPKLIDF